jgi:hypothetical protein
MSPRKGQKEKYRRKTERREKKIKEKLTFYVVSLSSIGWKMYFTWFQVLVMSTSEDHTF